MNDANQSACFCSDKGVLQSEPSLVWGAEDVKQEAREAAASATAVNDASNKRED